MTDLITLPRAELKAALDALDEAANLTSWEWFQRAAARLRAALARPEQEPVAWQCQEHGDTEWFNCSEEAYGINTRRYIYRPLYTAPQQREWHPLTDEEISKCLGATATSGDTLQLISAIAAALKEKNHD